VDNNWSLVESKMATIGLDYLAPTLKNLLPKTDSARIDLVQRHLGQAAIDLYLFHSEANENERPEVGQALANSVYQGMENMMKEMFGIFADMLPFFVNYAIQMAEEPVQSLVEDITYRSSALYADRTDDLHLTLRINAPHWPEAIEPVRGENNDHTIYDILGRPVSRPAQHGVYIQNGQKIIR